MDQPTDISRFVNLARRVLPPGAWVVQIGAADGRYVDPVYPLLRGQVRPDLHLLAVEPVPWLFEQLRQTYQGNPNVRPVNAAVSRERGAVEIAYVRRDHSGNAPEWAIGLGTRLPIHNRLVEFADRIESVTATGVRLIDLIGPVGAPQIDALVIDIEGHEPDVFEQLADLPQTPFLIMYEHDCVPAEGMHRIRSIAASLGYRSTVGRTNTILQRAAA